MSEQTTWRFKINAYSPSTMPLARLIEYLKPLADLTGTEDLHLVDIEEGCVASALAFPAAMSASVAERLVAVSAGRADEKGTAAYARIEELLADDQTDARIEGADGATILQFPGSTPEVTARPITVREDGHYDGILQSVGGTQDIVPIKLTDFDGDPLTGFRTTRDVAKALGPHLFDPVRLIGTGTWIRDEEGWHLTAFRVDRFDTLAIMDTREAVNRLREVDFRLEPDAASALLRERLEEAG